MFEVDVRAVDVRMKLGGDGEEEHLVLSQAHIIWDLSD